LDKYQYISLNFNIFRFFEPAKLPKSLHICNKKTKKAFFFLIFFVDSKKYRTFAAKLWLNSMKTPLFNNMLCAQISKITAIVCGMILCVIPNAHANNNDTLQVVSEECANDFKFSKPNTAHWSLFLDAGANLFDGDLGNRVNPFFAPSVGLGFAYNFNTTWGLGAEYMFSMHQVKRGNEMLLKGNMHRVHAFVTFDIFNAWRPYRPSKIFALNIIAGGGAGYSQLDLTPKNEVFVPLVVVGADFQFNVSKSVALGLKGVYSYAITGDAVDGSIRGTSNDGIVDLMLSVRYKFDTKKKPHVLNEDSELQYINQLRDNISESVEPLVQEVLASEPRKRDTIVVFDTVVVKEEVAAPVMNNVYYVYFELNKSVLDDDALKAIQQVAAQIEANQDLCLEVVAYGDNTGSVAYNKTLINARVDKVVAELKDEYGVAAERIVGHSGGIIKGKRSTGAYAPNRRAEIRLINKEEFDAISQELATEEETKATNCKDGAQAIGKTIVVKKGMTLGGIAKAQYGNAACWKYIYNANTNVLSNPDKLQEGQVLVIPELTKKQRDAVK